MYDKCIARKRYKKLFRVRVNVWLNLFRKRYKHKTW